MMNQTSKIKTLIVFGLRWWLLIQAIQVIEDDYYDDSDHVHHEPLMKNPNNSFSPDDFHQESIHRILEIKTCGFRRLLSNNNNGSETFDSYIVGGKPSSPDSWPWMVAIYRMRKFLCGGTIINARHILTAAHCVKRSGYLIPNDHLQVLIGAHRIKQINWPIDESINNQSNNSINQEKTDKRIRPMNGFWVSVTMVIVHENYSLNTMQNDIAMLRLNSTLQFQKSWLNQINSIRNESKPNMILTESGDNVAVQVFYQPICLPALDKIPADHNELIGRNATIIGWGHQYEGGDITPILNEVQVPIISNEQCTKTYGTRRIHRTKQICALYPDGGRDSCQGDSGGAMMASNDHDYEAHDDDDHDGNGDKNASNRKSKQFYQIGIVSWGRGCARPNIPGVYTRVSEYLDWILAKVKQTSFH